MPKDKKISLEEVEHIAELARIELSGEEKKKFSDELSDVLGYVEQLQEVNTDGIEPMSQATGMVNVLREDVAENCDEDVRKKIIESFPEEKEGYVKVKQIL